MNEESTLKELIFAPAARKALQNFPAEVRSDMGFALYQAQLDRKPSNAKPLKGFSGSGVLEVVEDFDGNTFRAVYTVRFAEFVYVLHCFQKKSKQGIATPKQDIELIKQRLKAAEADYKRWQQQNKNQS